MKLSRYPDRTKALSGADGIVDPQSRQIPHLQHNQPIPRAMTPTQKTCLTAALLALITIALTGCGTYANLHLESPLSGATLSPKLTTIAYTFSDENTVDIYLSDLSEDQLAVPFDDNASGWPTGQMMHIHMFIRPSPGKTPIEPQSSNCSIRHLILAPGATGLYGGGGFLLPSSSAKSGTFGGSITAGTLRLQASSPNFNDALGPTGLRASFKVKENRELAITMARRFEETMPRPED